jgi:hypothetical protein
MKFIPPKYLDFFIKKISASNDFTFLTPCGINHLIPLGMKSQKVIENYVQIIR